MKLKQRRSGVDRESVQRRRSRAVGRRVVTVAGSVALVVAGLGFNPLSASADSARVVVVHAETLPEHAHRTSLPSSLTIEVVMTPRHAALMDSLVHAVSTPSSPEYRRFLSPAQYASEFAPKMTTVDQLRSYFIAQGLTVRYERSEPLDLHLSGRPAKLEAAFASRLVADQSAGGGVTAYFATSATLPESVAHAITAVDGLSSWQRPHIVHLTANGSSVEHTTSTPSIKKPGNCAGADFLQSSDGTSFLPNQQAAAYGIASEWAQGDNGAGQTIAIYELANFVPSDVNGFFACYGLKPSITVVNVDGGPQAADDAGGTSGPEGEADLDIEEAGVLAPGASIIVYQGTQNLGSGGLDTFQSIASADKASVVTTSWGGCESVEVSVSDIDAENVTFEQMALQGQTVFAASGDIGSSDCYEGSGNEQLAVDDPASQPLVTGVGGLTVTSLASTNPVSPLSESVWDFNDPGDEQFGQSASGGGESAVWPQQSWETGDGITSTTKRMVPDLSVMGDPSTGFIMYAGGSWQAIGGTSMGSPIMAAVTATADQACGGRLGTINPTIYAMADNDTGFDDVTVGSNYIFRTTRNEYDAGVGYDMASGLGSPDPSTFITGLCTIAASSAHSSVFVTPTAPGPDLTVGATATVTVRTAADAPINYATPTVTATEPGARPTVSALSNWTNANGSMRFAVDTTLPGVVHLSVAVGATVVATTTANFRSTLRVVATPLAHLGIATSQLTIAARAPSSYIAVAISRAKSVLVETSSSTTVTNETQSLHLGVATGDPAASCAGTTCVAAFDDAGSIGVLTNVGDAAHTRFVFVSGHVALPHGVRSGSLSTQEGPNGSYYTVSYLDTAGQLIFVEWRAATGKFTVSNLTALFHLARADKSTSLVTTSASQSYVAVHVGTSEWLVSVGAKLGAVNVATVTSYATGGAGELVSTPQLVVDHGTHNELELFARSSRSQIISFTATASAPTTISSYVVVVAYGASDFAVTAPTPGTPTNPDDLLYLQGRSVYLAVDSPNWTLLSVSPLVGRSLVARSLGHGSAPTVATSTAQYTLQP